MLQRIDWQKILNTISSHTKNEITKSRLQDLSPSSPAAAKQQVKSILDAQEALTEAHLSLSSLDLVRYWIQRLRKQAILSPLELKDVRSFLSEVDYVYELVEQSENTWLNSFSVENLKPLFDRLVKSIDSEGNVLMDATPELTRLNREKVKMGGEIQGLLKNILHQHGPEEYLQDKFVTTRDGRWVVPVKHGMQGKFKGIVHDVSNSGQSIYIEPESVVHANNKLREIELAIQAEMERLLKEISQRLREKITEIENSFLLLLDLDFYFTLAKFNTRIDGQKFEFSDDFDLVQLRNPLLVYQGHSVVSNSLRISHTEPVLLISGPNAGGKTILLKSLGIAARMAACGLPICAEASSKIPFIENIYISVGDSQNIREGLSTFAAHIQELKDSLAARSQKDLILIDEICGSTDPEEGAAIARAFLQNYADRKIFNLTTSHLGPLKSGWKSESGVNIGSMDFDETRGLPTYKVVMGLAGSSFALKTAKQLGVPENILHEAYEYLSEDWKERHRQMESLEITKQRLMEQEAHLEDLQKENQKLKSEYEAKLLNFEKQKQKAMEELTQAAEKRLEQFLEDSKKNKAANVFELKADLPKIIKAPESKEITAEDFAEHFPPGTEVFITSLQKRGIVQSRPNQKGEVQVLSNSMHLSLHFRFLQRHEGEKAAKINPYTISKKLASEDRKLDIRGMTMEEALQALEVEVDEALRQGSDRIQVVHGHGSGVLKKAVRTFCSRSDFIKKWHIADKSQGGDGVTWIEI
tara:strand:+ start:3867 stop:6131 length:2265 start_codon:yes stop_codon:yes gene_type:complete